MPRSPSRSPSTHRQVTSRSRRDRSSRLPDPQRRSRQQKEAEMVRLEEETARRVEEGIRRRVEAALLSEEVKLQIMEKIEAGKKRLFQDTINQLQVEKEAALVEAREREEVARREREQLDRMLKENQRRVEESQRKAALEQQREEEERFRELGTLQRQKDEAMRRKKLEEDPLHSEQMKLSGKNNSQTKMPFSLGLK